MYGYGNTYTYQQDRMNQYNPLDRYMPQTPYIQQNAVNQQQAVPQQVIKGRPVSSYDEAKASMIDLDGSMFVFPDIANKRIYTKQIMLDGSAELKVYVLVEQNKANEAQNNEQYVLRSDFDNAMLNIKTQIEKIMEGMPYEQPADHKPNAK